jgi:hypothetical protein
MVDLATIFIPGARFRTDASGAMILPSGRPTTDLPSLRIKGVGEGMIVQGSLPKVLRCDNVAASSVEEVSATISHLERIIGLTLSSSRIFRLEVGATLLVQRPPAEYLESWSFFGRYRQNTYSNCDTVKLVTRNKEFIGYDKGKELRPGKLPPVFAGYHGLRLELKYLKHQSLLKVFGKPLSPWDLVQPEIWSRLRDQWKEFYFQIPKERLTRVSTKGLTPTEYRDALAHLGLCQVGESRAKGLIATGQASGDIRKQYATRMRALIRDLITDERITDSTKLTQEVDDAVRRV